MKQQVTIRIAIFVALRKWSDWAAAPNVQLTNHNVQQDDLRGEHTITREHVQNNKCVRDMLGERGIKPEKLPAEQGIKKLERQVKSEEKKIEKQSGRLP